MIDVLIDDISLFDNYKAVLSKHNIGFPRPKVSKVDIPGRHGELETDPLPSLSNRKLAFTLTALDTRETARLIGLLHNKEHRITFTDALNTYFFGRCVVESYDSAPASRQITVTVDAYPLPLLRKAEGVSAEEMTEENIVYIANGTLYAPVPLRVVYVDGSLTINGASCRGVSEVDIRRGVNTASGSGRVKIWRGY